MIHKKTISASGVEIAFVSFDVPAADAAGLETALSECDRAMGLQTVVRQTLFLSAGADRKGIEHTVTTAYGGALPATTYAYQPPAEGHAVSCELWAMPAGARVERRGGVSLASSDGVTWAFLGGLETAEGEDLHEGTRRILKKAQELFSRGGGNFNRTVRTWYYIGNILGSDKGSLRYDQANRARNDIYADMWPDLRLSPASTGIGMSTNRLAYEGLTLSGNEAAYEVTWIDNPLQTHPYHYDIDAPLDSKPSFSRGAAVRFGKAALFFISGTASIRESDVVHTDDPDAQTQATIENIATLMGSENLTRNYNYPRGATLDDLVQFRVYVKRPEHVSVVRACCERHFPDVPHAFVLADVCRPECLVEIEGVAAFQLDDAKERE